MSVDADTVKRVARLARIALPEERVAPMVAELNGILDWVAQLDALDTRDVPPMTRVVDMDLKRRPDRVTDGGYPQDLMANAPLAEDGFFAVPKVVE